MDPQNIFHAFLSKSDGQNLNSLITSLSPSDSECSSDSQRVGSLEVHHDNILIRYRKTDSSAEVHHFSRLGLGRTRSLTLGFREYSRPSQVLPSPFPVSAKRRLVYDQGKPTSQLLSFPDLNFAHLSELSGTNMPGCLILQQGRADSLTILLAGHVSLLAQFLTVYASVDWILAVNVGILNGALTCLWVQWRQDGSQS